MAETDFVYPQIKASIFDPEGVDLVWVPAGRVNPWQLNSKTYICQGCRNKQAPGRAMRFYKGRGSSAISSGYYCISCLAQVLRSCDWHWNPVKEELFQRRPYTMHPISGQALADALLLEGERGLFQVITGMRRNNVQVSGIVS